LIIEIVSDLFFLSNKKDHLQSLSEKVKFHSFRWMKSKYVTFDFDYLFLEA